MNLGPTVIQALAWKFDAATAKHLTEKFAAASLPLINREGDRVFLAIILLSKGDARRALRELAEAEKDWRDTLCAAGLENENWREVLRAQGYEAPP
jgi:hypothetical protein